MNDQIENIVAQLKESSYLLILELRQMTDYASALKTYNETLEKYIAELSSENIVLGDKVREQAAAIERIRELAELDRGIWLQPNTKIVRASVQGTGVTVTESFVRVTDIRDALGK